MRRGGYMTQNRNQKSFMALPFNPALKERARELRKAGNITLLNAEIERIVEREDVLRQEIAEIIAEIEGGAEL
jgi:hypothetical protein